MQPHFIPWFSIRGWRIPLPIVSHAEPFALLVTLGVVLGVVVTIWRARRAGVPIAVIVDAIVHVVVTGFIMSRVFDAVVYSPGRVAADPLYLIRQNTGLSSFGGFLGALVGAWIWKLRRRHSILAVTDHIAFGFPLGFGLGRVGCFLTHDHPGIVTDFPLAVGDYHVGKPPFLPRHDLGLYEALCCTVLVLLFFALGRRPRRPGLYLGLLPALYAPVRFCLDFLRETPSGGGDVRYLGLTPGQYGAVVLGGLGIGVLVFIARRPPLTFRSKPNAS